MSPNARELAEIDALFARADKDDDGQINYSEFRALVRETGADMFGLGSREAVVAALSGRDRDAFGAPAAVEDLLDALRSCGFTAGLLGDGTIAVEAEPSDVRVRALAFAFGWQVRRTAEGSTGPSAILARFP